MPFQNRITKIYNSYRAKTCSSFGMNFECTILAKHSMEIQQSSNVVTSHLHHGTESVRQSFPSSFQRSILFKEQLIEFPSNITIQVVQIKFIASLLLVESNWQGMLSGQVSSNEKRNRCEKDLAISDSLFIRLNSVFCVRTSAVAYQHMR